MDEMTNVVEYRSANLGDVRSIAALHAANWRRAYRGNFRDEYLDGDIFSERQGVWSARLSHPPANQYVRVAIQDARIIGFVCAFASHDGKWGSLIDNLHVDATAQGLGIGSTLMRNAGSWLVAMSADVPVYLLVWELNPARALYERLGGVNSGMLEVENPGGGRGRYFRYVWERPQQLGLNT